MQFSHLNGDECLAIILSSETDEKTTRVKNGRQHKAGLANNAAPTRSRRRLLERLIAVAFSSDLLIWPKQVANKIVLTEILPLSLR